MNIATQDDDETASFRAKRFDRARGATVYTLNLPGELASHASAASDLARLCTLAADGRLDGQAGLGCSWRQPGLAIDALLNRRIGGKAVLHMTDRLSPRDGRTMTVAPGPHSRSRAGLRPDRPRRPGA